MVLEDENQLSIRTHLQNHTKEGEVTSTNVQLHLQESHARAQVIVDRVRTTVYTREPVMLCHVLHTHHHYCSRVTGLSSCLHQHRASDPRWALTSGLRQNMQRPGAATQILSRGQRQ